LKNALDIRVGGRGVACEAEEEIGCEMLHFDGLVYRGQQLRIKQQFVKETHRENFGRVNKRDNRFNRELGRRLKRQVLRGSRESRNGGGLSKLVVEFRDAKTARIPRRLGVAVPFKVVALQ
jgi:hypothetical protein